jgi:hypothetical protein
MFDKQNIRVQYLKISERIRNFLLSKKSREFLVFLLFVFLSSSFWLLLVLNDEYETEVTIPFRMKNVPENVVLTSELPQELKVGVKDRGTVLVNYLLGQTFYPVTIDFEDYADRGNQVRFLSRSLDKRISSQFNQSTKLLSVKPDTLELIYTRAKAKKVPVRLRGEVKAERQFYISDIVYSPDSVMVYAPNEILDTITAAYTENLYLEQVADTTHRRVNLKPVKGARFTPSYNDVTFYVDIYSEKSVEVPVMGINFPDDKTLRTFPSKVQVTFQVGLSQFKHVTEEDFKVVVDYNTLEGNGNEKCKLHLLEIPANVIHTRINPKEIDYIIEQKVYSYD